MDVLDVLLRVLAVLLAFLLLPLLVGQAEHKAMAHMQGRVGPDVRGRIPRLGPTRRRRREVRPEGRHRARRRGPPGLPTGPRRRPVAVHDRADRDPRRGGRPGRPDGRRRRLLRTGRDGRGRARLAHGRLGLRQQVLAARRTPHRRPADGVRAADAARRRLGRDGRRHPLAPRHPGRLGMVVAALADHRRSRLLHRRTRRTPAPALRRPRRRLRDHLRRVHRVHRTALRALPPRGVRGHRRALRADRRALPGRLARSVGGRRSAGCGRC